MEMKEDQIEFIINLFKYMQYLIYSIFAFINGLQIYSQILYLLTITNNCLMHLLHSKIFSNAKFYLHIIKIVHQNSYLSI